MSLVLAKPHINACWWLYEKFLASQKKLQFANYLSVFFTINPNILNQYFCKTKKKNCSTATAL